MSVLFRVLMCLAIAANVLCAAAIRHKTPGSDFPIAMATEIPASSAVVHFSGAVPTVINKSAPKGSREAYGDTEAQTISALQSIEKSLKSLGMETGDVVKMQVFLVGDPKNSDKMDFDGFMRGYVKFFGGKNQPNLPSRSVFQVVALANPAWLVEIEVTAVRKSGK